MSFVLFFRGKMIGQKILHYEVLEKLGEGGMGVVYKARDTRLDRHVALKFLPHGLDSHERERARLLQEARAIAILSHPGICTIHDIQEVDGQQFIVMEFVEGRTLREIIPIPKIRDAVLYGIQIAEALQEAHTHGIVHRDIKTENIMVNQKNAIKVMDFGLAKLKGSMRLTASSSTVGTLGYMSPEQIQGADVDARSDIFSFGVVLFEMLTGRLPFAGEHSAAIMYSIINENPEPISKYRADVPRGLEDLISQMLEKDPEQRPQSAAVVAQELRHVQDIAWMQVVEPVGQTKRTLPSRDASSKKSIRSKKFRAGIVVASLLAVTLSVLLLKPNHQIRSIAVLPFVNVGGDSTTEYLSDGFTESLINSLSRIPRLKLMSRNSVFHLKGKDVDATQAGRELGVNAVVAGQVSLQRNELAVSVELIDVGDNSHIWGERYERKASDILAIESSICGAISDQLRITLSGDQQKELTAPPTENTEAFHLYLKGRFYWNKRTQDGFIKAESLYREAIERDPMYARAYAGLAEVYNNQGTSFLVPAKESNDKAKAAAQKAIELDERLASAHAVLAAVYETYEFNWNAAEREYHRAIELDQNDATTEQFYGMFLTSMGRYDEGLAHCRKAIELDPLSPILYASCGYFPLVAKRQYDEALEQAQKALDLEPDFPRAYQLQALTYFLKGNGEAAIKSIKKAISLHNFNSESIALLVYFLGFSNKQEAAEQEFRVLMARSKTEFVSPSLIALGYIGVGNHDEAFRWLNRAADIHDWGVENLKFSPLFDPLRKDPRFLQLIDKVGLPRQ